MTRVTVWPGNPVEGLAVDNGDFAPGQKQHALVLKALQDAADHFADAPDFLGKLLMGGFYDVRPVAQRVRQALVELAKAQELGTKQLTEEEFLRLLKQTT